MEDIEVCRTWQQLAPRSVWCVEDKVCVDVRDLFTTVFRAHASAAVIEWWRAIMEVSRRIMTLFPSGTLLQIRVVEGWRSWAEAARLMRLRYGMIPPGHFDGLPPMMDEVLEELKVMELVCLRVQELWAGGPSSLPFLSGPVRQTILEMEGLVMSVSWITLLRMVKQGLVNHAQEEQVGSMLATEAYLPMVQPVVVNEEDLWVQSLGRVGRRQS